jgi:hypothetical protein
MATSNNISLSNARAEFAKLFIRLHFKYKVLIKTLNCLKDIYIKVLVRNL